MEAKVAAHGIVSKAAEMHLQQPVFVRLSAADLRGLSAEMLLTK